MIDSIYQIDFIDSAGSSTRLLNYGDGIGNLIDFAANQSEEVYNPINSRWGTARALGGSRRPLQWSRSIEHPSLAAAASYCIKHSAMLPLTRAGNIRVSVESGEVWDLCDAVIISASTRLDTDGEFATNTSYQVSAGETIPVSGLAHFSGIPHAWILGTLSAQTLHHSET